MPLFDLSPQEAFELLSQVGIEKTTEQPACVEFTLRDGRVLTLWEGDRDVPRVWQIDREEEVQPMQIKGSPAFPPDGDFQLVFGASYARDVKRMVARAGLEIFQMPMFGDDLPTYGVKPRPGVVRNVDIHINEPPAPAQMMPVPVLGGTCPRCGYQGMR